MPKLKELTRVLLTNAYKLLFLPFQSICFDSELPRSRLTREMKWVSYRGGGQEGSISKSGKRGTCRKGITIDNRLSRESSYVLR